MKIFLLSVSPFHYQWFVCLGFVSSGGKAVFHPTLVLIANARETCVLSTFLMFSRWKFDSRRIIGNRKAQAGNVIREIIYDTHGKSLYMYNSQGDEFRPKRIISSYRDLCDCVSMAIRAHGYRCNYRIPGDNQTVIQRRNKSVRIKIFPLFRVHRDYSRVAN